MEIKILNQQVIDNHHIQVSCPVNPRYGMQTNSIAHTEEHQFSKLPKAIWKKCHN
jgi:hypothetical protein